MHYQTENYIVSITIVGSTARGVGELDVVKEAGGKQIADAIEKAADEAQSSAAE